MIKAKPFAGNMFLLDESYAPERKERMDKGFILHLLLTEEKDGVVQGVLALSHGEWTQQIRKSLLSLASDGFIELSSEIELTEIGLKINCKLTEKALELKD